MMPSNLPAVLTGLIVATYWAPCSASCGKSAAKPAIRQTSSRPACSDGSPAPLVSRRFLVDSHSAD